MSSIGRIFIVLNLGLAALCLGWASNHLGTADNFKRELADLQVTMDETVAQKDVEIQKVRGERSAFESDLSNKRNELATLQTTLQLKTTELDKASADNADLQARVVSFENSLGALATTQDNLQELYDAADKAKEEALSAKRDAEDAQAAALAAQRAAENSLRQANDTIKDLNTEKTTQAKEIDDLEVQIEVLEEVTGTPASLIISMPLIDGAIVGTNTEIQPGLVAINKGTEDGVRRGFTFDVYRGGVYKGRVRVETVQANMCTAVILKTYEGRTIAEGDSAATRL
jgi:hypothetical protein